MPYFIEKGDLVSKNVDCIVNASNVKLQMVEGVARAIFHRAGEDELTEACKYFKGCNVGDAVITPSFNLVNTKAIIHAVGPIYINGKHNEEKNLISAYNKCFKYVKDNKFNSIAFPLLSGEFNYPLYECFEVGRKTIYKNLIENPNLYVYTVMYKNFPEMLNEEQKNEITNYVVNYKNYNKKVEVKKTFNELITSYLKNTKYSHNELAARANLTIDSLNKIIDKSYEEFILKEHIFELVFALDLNIDQMFELLSSKNFTIEKGNLQDALVCLFLEKNDHDILKLNSVFFQYNLRQLGSN